LPSDGCEPRDLIEAVARTLSLLKGTYGLAVVSPLCPQFIIGARLGSPLVLGIGRDETFLASDPAALAGPRDVVASLLGRTVVFGICLGQQVLAEALGGRTYKLPFGHHGSNHPVRHERSGRVEITAQNHNYAVDRDTLPSARVTHVNLNDGVVEGFCVESERAFCVQYHPEAGPGPHDARYLFDAFVHACEGGTFEGL